MSLADDGTVVVNNGDQVLTGKYLKAALDQNAELIESWLQRGVDQENRDLEQLRTVHHLTPDPRRPRLPQLKEFCEEKPTEPIFVPLPEAPMRPKERTPSALSKLIPLLRRRHEQKQQQVKDEFEIAVQHWQSQRQAVEIEHRRLREEFSSALEAWRRQRDEHQSKCQQAHEEYIHRMQTDPQFMSARLEEVLGSLDWPLETSAYFDLADEGRVLLLDVDLPEVENLPMREARLAKNKRRIEYREPSETQRRKDYALHVHGIAIRLAGEVFTTLPKLESVLISAYSQRRNPATGRIRDEYIYSARMGRATFVEFDFAELPLVDPVQALERFELVRKMTKTGVFRPIEPLKR